MSNPNMDGLPPEMQARINQIIEQAKSKTQPETPHQAAIAPQAPTPPPVKQPSLMDHVIQLRQEVAELRQQVAATMQVTDAVGQAVGQMYAMFQQQTTPSNFSTTFQEDQSLNEPSDY